MEREKTKIWRGGLSQDKWRQQTLMNIGLRQYENTAMVDVYLDSKGGGVTHLGIGFLPEAFDELIETMMAVDREAVITAFSRASLKYRRKAKRFAKSASS